MIHIKSLTDKDKGRKVIYHPEHGENKTGELSSWNDHYVFVKFKEPNAAACDPNDVSFEFYIIFIL